MFCDPPKFDFTIRWHVLMVGLENMLAILATVRWALSVRCTAFYRALTPAAEALLSRWWLKRKNPARTVEEILKAGHLLAPRKKQPNHILEDADKMENSLAKLASSSLDFCACLYLELLGFIFLYMQREDPPKGVHSLPQSGMTAEQSQLALERTMWGTLPRRAGSTAFWFREVPGRRNLYECFQGQVTFLPPPPIYLWPARARLQHSTAEKERILLLKSIKQSQTNGSFPGLPGCAQVTNSG